MNQEELLEKLVATEGLPYRWCYCFNEQCPWKETCVRSLSVKYLGSDCECGDAVYPHAWQGGECEMFCQLHVEKRAWGFDNLFKDVKACDAHGMRLLLRSYLRSKGQYYRYKLGQLKLTPAKQADILRLFRSKGYPNVCFDHYEDVISYKD